jgi:hypothetical protein
MLAKLVTQAATFKTLVPVCILFFKLLHLDMRFFFSVARPRITKSSAAFIFRHILGYDTTYV